MGIATECPVCGSLVAPVFSATVLRQHRVAYLSCGSCGLLKTESPFWLEEAYRTAIVPSDTGVARRNLAYRRLLEPILYSFFGEEGTFLVVASGYGLLARLLRDIGFDCYTTDKFCRNLFALGFEPGDGFEADALFAFEVLEHLEDPRRFLVDAFSQFGCRTLIFSTVTFEGEPPPMDWWYYGFGHGQHVTFYQRRTLEALARALGTMYVPMGPDTHLFTDRPLSGARRAVLRFGPLRRALSSLVRLKRRNPSRTWDDHLFAKEFLDPK